MILGLTHLGQCAPMEGTVKIEEGITQAVKTPKKSGCGGDCCGHRAKPTQSIEDKIPDLGISSKTPEVSSESTVTSVTEEAKSDSVDKEAEQVVNLEKQGEGEEKETVPVVETEDKVESLESVSKNGGEEVKA